MDYFEGVVIEYLRADRALFLNTQYCIQVNKGKNPDTSGPHWYCDAVAIDFRSRSIFLCEITFANPPASLKERLSGWNDHWVGVHQALVRDSKLPEDWTVRPWLFIREDAIPKVIKDLENLKAMTQGKVMFPVPKITPLEMTMPWEYTSWDRQGEKPKPPIIPVEMQ